MHSLGIVQWDSTRRDHPGYLGRVSGKGPVTFCPGHVAYLEQLVKYQVSRTPLRVSKNMKFRLSRNSTKFDMVARFRETIPTAKSVSSSEI